MIQGLWQLTPSSEQTLIVLMKTIYLQKRKKSKTSGNCDTLAESYQDFSQNRASHFQSSVHLNNISSLNCNTGTINSQQHEQHGGKYCRQNVPSLPQNEIKSLDRVES